MKHWSASRSCEYCSVGKTSEPPVCGAARNCPISNECVDFSDIFFLKASTLPGPLGVVCENEHNPTAFSDGHRKKPASAGDHEDADRWLASVSDDLYGNSFVPVEDESLKGRTRRKILSGHWTRACLHTCESVFFGLKPWIIAFFPRFSASEPDFSLVQNAAKSFNADRGNNLFCHQILTQLLQRPAYERAAQKVWGAFGGLCDKSPVIFSKLRRPTRTWLWFQSLKAIFVEFFDNSTDMMFGVMDQFRDGWRFIALFGRQDYLGPADFNATGTASQNTLNLLAFIHSKFTYVETHSIPPCNNVVASLCNIGIVMGKN
jgi:hypothetical protein